MLEVNRPNQVKQVDEESASCFHDPAFLLDGLRKSTHHISDLPHKDTHERRFQNCVRKSKNDGVSVPSRGRS